MEYVMLKRIGNLVFAGALVVGSALPLSTDVYASETPALSSQGNTNTLQYINNDTGQKKNQITLLSVGDTVSDLPTLEEYLGKLVCSGCGRRCPLTSLQCGRGQSYLSTATSDYEAMVANTAVVVDLEPEVEAESSANSGAQAAIQKETVESSSSQGQADDAQAADNQTSGQSSSAQQKPANESVVLQPEGDSSLSATPQVSTTDLPTDENNTLGDFTSTAMEYIPLAGLAFGGVYFASGNIRKRKKK